MEMPGTCIQDRKDILLLWTGIGDSLEDSGERIRYDEGE
jgi:hypothetical protein